MYKLLFVVSVLVLMCDSARILGFFPSISKSHLIINMATVKPLIERGHNVTIVTTKPLPGPTDQFEHILLDEINMEFSDDVLKQMIFEPKTGIAAFYQTIDFLEKMMNYSNNTLNTPKMKHLMATKSFDIVLLGQFINNFHVGLAAHFKCPQIMIWINKPMHFINDIIGNPAELSFVPVHYSQRKQPMSFTDRLVNVAIGSAEILATKYLNYKMRVFYEYNFPPNNYISYDEAIRNVSLIFTASHVSEGPVRPNVPALVEIGGIQVKSKPDPLPEKLRIFLDSAEEHGAIYFSLGSNMPTSLLKPEVIEVFFKVFSSLKQKIIWKWEKDDLPGKAENILFDKWLPQDDILAHPNTVLFLSHGGLGSIVESKYHGVPILGFPIFADQHGNLESVKSDGWGIDLNHLSLTEDLLRNSIIEMLENKTYINRVKYLSAIYRDRPTTPAETAAYWVEYVIRHRGAKHIQSPVIHMSWYQYYLLDVLAVVFGTLYAIVKIIKIIIFLTKKIICKLILKKKIAKGKKTL